jgi:ABC-type amino acid transport substrate-binding protein
MGLFNNRDIKDLKVGVVQDTTAETFYLEILVGKLALADLSNLTKAENNKILFSKLDNNKIDLVIYDYIRGIIEVDNNPEWVLEAIPIDKYKILPEKYGISVNNEDPELKVLLDKIIKRSR